MHDPDSVAGGSKMMSYNYNQNYLGVNTQTGEMFEHIYTGRTSAGPIVDSVNGQHSSHVPSSIPANGQSKSSVTSIVVDVES